MAMKLSVFYKALEPALHGVFSSSALKVAPTNTACMLVETSVLK